MKKNKPNKIIIHHSASSSRTTTKQINKWHKDRKFYYNEAFDNYIGYHYLVHANGRIEQTKLLKDEGCHCIGQNTKSIGVCVIGNFEKTKPTNKQMVSLLALADYLTKTTGKVLPISGHQKFSATKCPGKYLQSNINILNMKMIYKLFF